MFLLTDSAWRYVAAIADWLDATESHRDGWLVGYAFVMNVGLAAAVSKFGVPIIGRYTGSLWAAAWTVAGAPAASARDIDESYSHVVLRVVRGVLRSSLRVGSFSSNSTLPDSSTL